MSTRRARSTAVRRWRQLAVELSLPPLGDCTKDPRVRVLAQAFVPALHDSGRGPTGSTIGGYLSGVRNYFSEAGFPDPTARELNPLVRRAVDALRRERPAHRPVRKIKPISPSFLRRTRPAAGTRDYYLWRVVALAFFGLHRVSELRPWHASGPSGFGARTNMVICNERASGGRASLTIDRSKSDRFSKGAVVYHNATGSDLCPATLVRECLREVAGRGANTPLFTHRNGAVVTATQVGRFIKRGARTVYGSDNLYNTHSCRVGGVNTMVAAGYQIDAIMTMGRWRSTAVREYLRQCAAALQLERRPPPTDPNTARVLQAMAHPLVALALDPTELDARPHGEAKRSSGPAA